MMKNHLVGGLIQETSGHSLWLQDGATDYCPCACLLNKQGEGEGFE